MQATFIMWSWIWYISNVSQRDLNLGGQVVFNTIIKSPKSHSYMQLLQFWMRTWDPAGSDDNDDDDHVLWLSPLNYNLITQSKNTSDFSNNHKRKKLDFSEDGGEQIHLLFIINTILAHPARAAFYPCENILQFERDKRGASLIPTSATEKKAALIYGRSGSRTVHLRLPAFSLRMI